LNIVPPVLESASDAKTIEAPVSNKRKL
jgi:hypothetical protein